MTKAVALVWKNFQHFNKHLDQVEKKRTKAAQVAAKVEGFRLSKELRADLYDARPGGQKLAPLSQIARRTKTGKLKKNARKPLAAIAHLVRYRTTRQGGKLMNVEVGFVHPKMRKGGWKKLLAFLQTGGTRVIQSAWRKKFGRESARVGGILKKRGSTAAKFFFLKRETFSTVLPARPVIDPFWNANKAQAQKNIITNWERRMKGERI